jgi:DNA mismatch repair protein MutS
MSFTVDKQTLEDLNILGKYKSNSIFSIFNQVHSEGGEKLMQYMFEQPLTDSDGINRRAELFRSFQDTACTFPFGKGELALAVSYLESNSNNRMIDCFIDLSQKKIMSELLHDQAFGELESGLKATLSILVACKEFLSSLSTVPEALANGPVVQLKMLFINSKLDELLNTAPAEKMSLWRMARYDHYLRHTFRAEMHKFTSAVYELDVCMTVASVARANGFTYAIACDGTGNKLEAIGLRHPGVKRAVANGISLSQMQNLLFLTGANMAGKSTFMKALGINLYLAHMGFPVASDMLRFSTKDGLYTSINVSDDLNKGYSHFYAEVLRVKAVAKDVAAGKDLFVIFDELFKGTNVKDAYDATLAVTQAFSNYTNCLFVISTHIVEVGAALESQGQAISFFYLPTRLVEGKPIYTYQLQPGISSDRHGMMIIENEGILQMLRS